MHRVFLEAIYNMKVVEVTFESFEKGTITRNCIPFDFGPSRRYRDGTERYHFYDLDSPSGNHNLSILPEQVIEIRLTSEVFDPGKYVTWQAINWFIKRDWGIYS